MLPMAITLNKYAVRCIEIALAAGTITPHSSAQTFFYDISRYWRKLSEATNFKSDKDRRWSEKEVLAGEVIISAVSYLQRLECRNIELLLRDTIERHARQNE